MINAKQLSDTIPCKEPCVHRIETEFSDAYCMLYDEDLKLRPDGSTEMINGCEWND